MRLYGVSLARISRRLRAVLEEIWLSSRSIMKDTERISQTDLILRRCSSASEQENTWRVLHTCISRIHPIFSGTWLGGRTSPLIVSNSTFRLFPDSLQNAATCFNQGFYGTVWGHRKRQSRKTLTQGVFTVFSRVSVSAGRVRGVTIWIYIWLLKVFLCICAQEVFVLCNICYM